MTDANTVTRADTTPLAITAIPDVDGIEARIARIEEMCAESLARSARLDELVRTAEPLIAQVAEDIKTQGIAGLLGMLMSVRKS